MVLKDFLSISGQGGLFKFISQGRNGVIVENIETKKRINVPATAKMSSLEDIAIFTQEQEVPLGEVMDKIYDKENGGQTITHKSENEALKNFMNDILPDYDQERVYVSDMKKLVQWYNLLHSHNLLMKEEEKKEEEGKEDEKTAGSEKAKAPKAKKAMNKPVAKNQQTKASSQKKTAVNTKTTAKKTG